MLDEHSVRYWSRCFEAAYKQRGIGMKKLTSKMGKKASKDDDEKIWAGTVMKWISVKDDTPPVACLIYIYGTMPDILHDRNSKQVTIARGYVSVDPAENQAGKPIEFYREGSCTLECGQKFRQIPAENVTHWMPVEFPEPPVSVFRKLWRGITQK